MKSAKILEGEWGDREQGMGDISHDLIVKRSGELALADGRRAEDYTDYDYETAEAELRGEIEPATGDNPAEGINGARLPEQVAGSTGHEAGNEYRDEDNIAVQLVREGIDEAVHDEFVESGRETVDGDDEPEMEPTEEPEDERLDEENETTA